MPTSAAFRVVASCAGFLADSYDLFTIDLVVLILELQYGEKAIGPAEKSLMVSFMLVGVVVGQLTFGYVADWLGRKWTFVVTAALTVVGAALGACCMQGSGSFNLPVQLALCRLLLGLGVGGEYPLSATVTAEAADEARLRGRLMATVISMQGFGMMLSCCVAMAAISAGASMEATWRLLLAFGALPSLVAFGLRWQMDESRAFEDSQRESKAASESRHRQVWEVMSSFWRVLLGTASSWFMMNVFMYSLGSFKSTILYDIMPHAGLSGRQKVMANAHFAAITSGFAIIGFALGHVLIDRLSRFTMQLFGFVAVAVTFFVIAALSLWGSSSAMGGAFLALLGLMFFFLNAGPNLTTFILPAEVFPTRTRATCHGISAACGKMGAVVGTILLPPVAETAGMTTVYLSCGVISALAALITFFCTPRQAVELSILDGPVEGAIDALTIGRSHAS